MEFLYLVAEAYVESEGSGWWPQVEERAASLGWWEAAGADEVELVPAAAREADATSGPDESASTQPVPAWIRDFKGSGGKFLQRSIGAAAAYRLKKALLKDGAVFSVAVRRALRELLPMAHAVDVCIVTAGVSPQDLKSLGVVTMDLVDRGP